MLYFGKFYILLYFKGKIAYLQLIENQKPFIKCLQASPASIDPRADIITDPHIRIEEAVRSVRQLNNGPIQETVRGNLLDALGRMANASAVAG